MYSSSHARLICIQIAISLSTRPFTSLFNHTSRPHPFTRPHPAPCPMVALALLLLSALAPLAACTKRKRPSRQRQVYGSAYSNLHDRDRRLARASSSGRRRGRARSHRDRRPLRRREVSYRNARGASRVACFAETDPSSRSAKSKKVTASSTASPRVRASPQVEGARPRRVRRRTRRGRVQLRP